MTSESQMPPPRIKSIDALRGLVMVLMVLDHVRDFFFDLRLRPEDLSTASTPLFLTRWVTHFCAPTFVFLAGLSAWMYGQKVSRGQLSKFLLTRGLWLLFLEFTLIHWALALESDAVPYMFLVIAAIGTSMMALACVAWLKPWAVGLMGVCIIAGHNLLDPIDAEQFGAFGFLWSLFHEGQNYVEAVNLEIGYSFLPWFGIMAAGYGFGSSLPKEPRPRIKFCLTLGIAMIAGFIVVRALNTYGDPAPWSSQPSVGDALLSDIPAEQNSQDFVRTLLSFLRCTKYPPSLCYTLMTLGPALIVLALFDLARPISSLFCVYGRVPLFFYIVHFYVVHFSSRVWYWWYRGEPLSAFDAIYGTMLDRPMPEIYGIADLRLTYIIWPLIVLALYPICVWYGLLKQTGKSRFWSYL